MRQRTFQELLRVLSGLFLLAFLVSGVLAVYGVPTLDHAIELTEQGKETSDTGEREAADELEADDWLHNSAPARDEVLYQCYHQHWRAVCTVAHHASVPTPPPEQG